MSQENIQKKSYHRRRKPRNSWRTIKKFVSFMSDRAWLMVLVFGFSALSVLLNALLPIVMGRITNLLVEGVSRGMSEQGGQLLYEIDYAAVGQHIVILVGLYLAASIFRFLQQHITTRVAQRTVYDLRRALKEKMGRLPVSYFDEHSTGDILSRVINDMDQIANALGQTLTQISTSVLQFITVLVIMFFLDPALSWVVLLSAIPISLGAIGWIAPKSQKQFSKRQLELGYLNALIEEVYSGHSAVKVNNQEDYEMTRFNKQSDLLNQASWKAEYFAGLLNPMIGFSGDVTYVLVAIIGGFKVLAGGTLVGTVQSFLQYARQFNQPFREMASLASTIQMTIAAAERIFEVLDEKEMEHPQGLASKPETPYKVEFDHVQFGYSSDPDELLMTDFNLEVEPGQMVAVVGPTGAGKSTLINLLERFYDVSGGAIYYEGTDIRNMSREALRSDFSMVLQDTWLFSGTIWDNLKYGSPDVSDEDVLKAAKAAHVHDFVERLPEGYETILEEDGTNLSQGQRQLITIARAFLQDPDVLILDEATSSVDTRTEVLIQRAMNRLLEGRTSFVVAHRLSTIRNADKIIVMNQGDVIEQGTHDQLMEAEGFYANLYNAQFA
ncbi:ABC transporter ATP-binding protein [Hutsoniella sourekii]